MIKRVYSSFVILLSVLCLTSCGSLISTLSPFTQIHIIPARVVQAASLSDGTINRPVTTTGCGQSPPLAVGSSGNIMIPSIPAELRGASTRLYRLHVPSSYQMNKPQPVVLVFHAYDGSAIEMEEYTGFSRLADQQDFIAVYPQGLLDGRQARRRGEPLWASIGPNHFQVDDLHYVSVVLDDLQQKLCVDNHRIYATGHLNGGGMTAFLACRLAGRIAAFAPISGDFYNLPGGCNPRRPVAILDVHGTADPIVPYNGGIHNRVPATINPGWPLLSIPQWVQAWATCDGCASGPTTFLRAGKVTGLQWTDCQAGTVVIHYRIAGGTHPWPQKQKFGDQSIIATIWLFFRTHPLWS